MPNQGGQHIAWTHLHKRAGAGFVHRFDLLNKPHRMRDLLRELTANGTRGVGVNRRRGVCVHGNARWVYLHALQELMQRSAGRADQTAMEGGGNV